MILYATCKAPLRVSTPTVILVCDHWNRGKTEVLSAQDGWTRIQGQTNIRPLSRLIKINEPAAPSSRQVLWVGGGQESGCSVHYDTPSWLAPSWSVIVSETYSRTSALYRAAQLFQLPS